MDPKNLNTLDPKLKEVYERVMGTSTPLNSSPQTQQQQSPPSPSPSISIQQPTIPHSPSPTTKTTPPPSDKPVINYAAITSKPSHTSEPKIFKPSQPQTTSFGVVNAEHDKSKPEADTENKKSKTKMILLLILIPLFLLAYTFVWIIIFGVDVMSIISNK